MSSGVLAQPLLLDHVRQEMRNPINEDGNVYKMLEDAEASAGAFQDQ